MNAINKKAKANFAHTIAISVPTAQLDPFPLSIGSNCPASTASAEIPLIMIPKMVGSHPLKAPEK
jgi:hypothetical protein